jgi:hypothetical protein
VYGCCNGCSAAGEYLRVSHSFRRWIMKERNQIEKSGGTDGAYKLELVGLMGSLDDRPPVTLVVLDANQKPLHSQSIGADGRFSLSAEVLKRAHRVVLGAQDEKGGVVADASISYRAEEFSAQINAGTLALAEGVWSRFRFHWACVGGSVQACRRRPWWFDSVVSAAIRPVLSSRILDFSAQRLHPSLNELILWPARCAPVCAGKVDVYRRTCCCWPIVFDDLRIDDLIRDLEIHVGRSPKLPPRNERFPPLPLPPVGDPLKTPFFKGGALNELAINAANDLHQLRTMPRDRAAQYINSRAYLLHRLCSCSQPLKVASGTLQPDGSFNICWLEPGRILLANCHEQFAYVVTQTIGGSSNVIYNGLAAHAWFAAGVHPALRTYNSHAYTCNETGSDGGDAYVFLDLIGDTESHELITPVATGWDRVAAPNSTSGLLFPVASAANGHLRNLGGAVELAFTFSLGMRAASVGARYYRVSISRADASGNPTGERYFYKQGLAWDKVAGSDIVPESIGPVDPTSVGGEPNLYRIPYSDESWVGSVRYHALINTLQDELNVPSSLPVEHPDYVANVAMSAANHLITLEIFNAAGERLRPLGTAPSGQSGTELSKPFKFRRWVQPAGSVGDETVEVPYAALTHLFCWDNRPPVADITRLVKDGLASNEECQFLLGTVDSQFAVEYRAYVPDERFHDRHVINWTRGLNASVENGGRGVLPTAPGPVNAGEPPAVPVASGSNTFQHMLTRLDTPAPPNIPGPPVVLQRCSFAVTLTTFSKTTNGEYMGYPHASETAAFALEIE